MSNADTKNNLKLHTTATLGPASQNSVLFLSSSLKSLNQSYFQQAG